MAVLESSWDRPHPSRAQVVFYLSAKKNSFQLQPGLCGNLTGRGCLEEILMPCISSSRGHNPLADLPGADLPLAKSTCLPSFQCFSICFCLKMLVYSLEKSE